MSSKFTEGLLRKGNKNMCLVCMLMCSVRVCVCFEGESRTDSCIQHDSCSLPQPWSANEAVWPSATASALLYRRASAAADSDLPNSSFPRCHSTAVAPAHTVLFTSTATFVIYLYLAIELSDNAALPPQWSRRDTSFPLVQA